MKNSSSRPTTFVLVHGGWHGGWCWKKLTPFLRAAGHLVFAPTLTGMGERAHLLTPDVDLETHIKDVVAVIEYEDLDNVVLVGHSYGGIVATGVADRIRTRLTQLVYLDAFVPDDGESTNDLIDSSLVSLTTVDGWRVAAPSVEIWGLTDEDDIAWAQARVSDQPLKTFSQPLRLSDDWEMPAKQAFIQTCDYSIWPHAQMWRERAERRSFECRALPFSAGHDAMITMPRELAGILLQLL